MKGLKATTSKFMWPVTKPDKEKHPAFEEQDVLVRNVEVINFGNDQGCTGNKAFKTNKDNADNRPVYKFDKMSLVNTGKKDLFKFYNADPKWLGYQVGNCRMLQCNGPYNVLVKDLDGSLLGKPGSVIGNNSGAANGTCKRYESWNGFECPNSHASTFEWGLAVFEVLNWKKDLFRPFIFNASNFYNNVTPGIDNRQEIYDISGERYPRYQSLIKLNQEFNVSNVGRKPKKW